MDWDCPKQSQWLFDFRDFLQVAFGRRSDKGAGQARERAVAADHTLRGRANGARPYRTNGSKYGKCDRVAQVRGDFSKSNSVEVTPSR